MSLQNEELDSIRTWHVLYILFHNSHKILSCSNKIITWEDVTDVKTDTDYYACRIPPKVQHPDALWATEKWWEFMWQNHNPGLNTNNPWIHQEKAPLRSAASRLHQLAEEDNEEEQDRNCHGRPNTCMGCTIDRLRKWLVSRNPTSGWKRPPYRTVQRFWSWQHKKRP